MSELKYNLTLKEGNILQSYVSWETPLTEVLCYAVSCYPEGSYTVEVYKENIRNKYVLYPYEIVDGLFVQARNRRIDRQWRDQRGLIQRVDKVQNNTRW